MTLLLITLFLLLLYAFLIFFYYRHWQQLPLFHPGGGTPKTPVSVIVAARNEAANLPGLLKALQVQTYPRELFEVIIVDDFSTDDTAAVAAPFLNDQVQMIKPEGNGTASSKKKAITAGIQKAAHDLVMVTDADCIPPPQWIETVAAFQHEQKASFIAAPVWYQQNGSLLHIFQTLDFITLQGITAASVSAGFHSMCNGANLAYKKSSFLAVGGFAGIDHLASGDDMLLMHKIWLREPGAVRYLKSQDAMVGTQPMPGWKELLQQRRRWASKTPHYNDRRIFWVLLFVYLFNCWFVVLLAAWLLGGSGLPLLIYLAVKTVTEWQFVVSTARFYNQQKLMLYFPWLQPVHILYTVVVGLYSQAGAYEWKGRKTK